MVAIGAVASMIAMSGCGGPNAPASACVPIKTDCQPLYEPPTYPTLYEKIFKPTCASGMGTCHTADSKKGGLFFDDPAQAYQLLLGKTDGRARIVPSNPGCSLLAEKVASTDPLFRMPPGNGLSAAELCDVMQWLGAGAGESP